MYKVFIDNHKLSIVPDTNKEVFIENVLQVHEPSKDEIRTLVEFLYETTSKLDAQLVAEQPEEVWEELQTVCPLVDAAGGIIKNEKEEVLFIYRNDVWDLPKGKAEKGEDMEECAKREVEEECGFSEFIVESELPKTYHIYFNKNDFVLKRTYWYEMSTGYNGKFTPQRNEGIEKIKWFSATKLEEPLSNTYRSIKELLIELFKLK